MEKYKCDTCDKTHRVYKRLEIPLPRLIMEMTEEERGKRVKESELFCLVDDEYFFISGYVKIDLNNHESPFFYWKVWVSISQEEFFAEKSNIQKGKVVQFEGNLENELPFYSISKGLKSNVIVQEGDEYLIVEIQITEDSKLKQDQLKPITEKRVIEIMGRLYHSSDRQNIRFDKLFLERLRNELLNAEKEYLDKGKDFVINISTEFVLFQIVSNQILEKKESQERGFGLHLSFDELCDGDNDEMKKFRSKKFSKKFDYHNLDGIPTYQIDLGVDKNRLEELVKELVIEVYQEELELIETDNFEL